MFSFLKKKEVDENVYAPVNGTCISLDDVKDAVFSSRMMGDGVAFQFDEDTVYAPCDGTVLMIANTLHAFGFQGDNGLELLLHIGLDTVNLNGEGFTALVQQGSNVHKGEPILKIDRAFMKEREIDLTTPLIITNGNDCTLTFPIRNAKVKKAESIVISKQ